MGTKSSKTIYILGAGSGHDIGMPLGTGLKKDIVNILDLNQDPLHPDYDQEVMDVLAQRGWEDQRFNACSRILSSLLQAESIDQFMYEQNDEDINFCSKLAIVQAILKRERKTVLCTKKRLGIEVKNKPDPVILDLKDTWFHSFWVNLKRDCRMEDLEDQFKKVLIINFNYDRILEEYLFRALLNNYPISPEEAIKLLANLEIFHPYGKVGDLQWQKTKDTICPIELGGIPNSGMLFELVKGIRTFGESESSKGLESIHNDIKASEKLIFLGFAFHEINMDLLFPRDIMVKAHTLKRIISTTTGISSHTAHYLRDGFSRRFGEVVAGSVCHCYIEGDMNCETVFKTYSPYMSIKV